MKKSVAVKEWVIVSILILVIIAFFYGLDNAFIPLTFSWLLAYISLPLVQKIEKKGLGRLQSSAIVLGTLSVVGTVLLILVIPPIYSDIRDAILALPSTLSQGLEKLDSVLIEYGIHIPYDRQSLIDYAGSYSEKISQNALASAKDVIANSLINVASIIVVLLNILLIPVFFFYVLNDYERLLKQIDALVPVSWKPRFYQIMRECDTILNGYIRGQLLVCVILGVLYSLGLLVVGIKFAFLIGFMTGFLSIIPYVGFSLGFLAALISGLVNYDGIGQIIGLVVAYGIIQFIESFFITPKIVGDNVGLTAFEAILMLIIMGNLIGFVGLFLAIPIGAIIKVLLRHLMAAYHETNLYRKSDPLA